MAKGSGKSSASSGTRKKHAKRAAGPAHPDELIPKEKKPKNKERGKKKEIRPKVYIAPVKPAPVQPDPLETTGLARILPAELLVVLRSLGKKALVTKIRALEDLQADWVDKCKREGEDGSLVYILVEMLPVWVRGRCIDSIRLEHNTVSYSSTTSPRYLCILRVEFAI